MPNADPEGFYHKRVELYDRIYHWKDYAGEASRLRDMLADAGLEDGARVLEAACGTGNYLRELARWYAVSGFDISAEAVAVAKDKVPQASVTVGDMVAFVPDEPVDAIACLFSSIGYMWPAERLHATARAFAASLRPGGVAIVEPWFTPEAFSSGTHWVETYEGDDMKCVRASVPRAEGRKSILEFHWLVARPHVGVEHFVDRHETWLYTPEEMDEAFAQAGFEVRRTTDGLTRGRGLLVATRG